MEACFLQLHTHIERWLAGSLAGWLDREGGRVRLLCAWLPPAGPEAVFAAVAGRVEAVETEES